MVAYSLLLLHVEKCHSFAILEQQLARAGIKDGVTWDRGLNFLGYFIAQVSDGNLR